MLQYVCVCEGALEYVNVCERVRLSVYVCECARALVCVCVCVCVSAHTRMPRARMHRTRARVCRGSSSAKKQMLIPGLQIFVHPGLARTSPPPAKSNTKLNISNSVHLGLSRT